MYYVYLPPVDILPGPANLLLLLLQFSLIEEHHLITYVIVVRYKCKASYQGLTTIFYLRKENLPYERFTHAYGHSVYHI